MFLNPWREDGRSRFNVIAARWVLCIYLIWRLSSYRWAELAAWPAFLFEQSIGKRIPGGLVMLLPHLGWVALATCLLLVPVLIGWKGWRIIAVVAAMGVLILGAFHQCVDNQGKRLMVPMMFLLLFSVFPDPKSIKQRPQPIENPLCWIALALATTYALAAMHRIKDGHFAEWVAADNLMRTIRWEAFDNLGISETFAAPILFKFPILASIAGIGTMIAELFFVVAIMFRLRITMAILAIAGMHLAILASMHLFFAESLSILLMFVDWETVIGWFRKRREAVA